MGRNLRRPSTSPYASRRTQKGAATRTSKRKRQTTTDPAPVAASTGSQAPHTLVTPPVIGIPPAVLTPQVTQLTTGLQPQAIATTSAPPQALMTTTATPPAPGNWTHPQAPLVETPPFTCTAPPAYVTAPSCMTAQPVQQAAGNVNGYHDLPQDIVPINSIHDMLGGNVSSNIKQKIVAGQFVDLATLLDNSVITHAPEKRIFISNGELVTREKTLFKITSIEKWSDAFLTFMSIFTGAHPNRSQELLKYMHDVRLGASTNRGMGWKLYDEQFRLRRAANPSTSWGVVDLELWLKYMVQTLPLPTSAISSFGHTKCFDFNYRFCSRQFCTYQHLCIRCGGEHSFISCPLAKPFTPRPGTIRQNFRPMAPRFSTVARFGASNFGQNNPSRPSGNYRYMTPRY